MGKEEVASGDHIAEALAYSLCHISRACRMREDDAAERRGAWATHGSAHLA
jgi:hypothetical protein